jgi:hypothetical protein
MFILSLGCLGGGRFGPSSLIYCLVLQDISKLVYVQRYVSPDIESALRFQVVGGQMQIDSFHAEDVRCLCLILMTLSHFSSDGKCISFPLMYYVDSLLQRPRLIRWMRFF